MPLQPCFAFLTRSHSHALGADVPNSSALPCGCTPPPPSVSRQAERDKVKAVEDKKEAELAAIEAKRAAEVAKIRAAAEAQPTKVDSTPSWKDEMAKAKKEKASLLCKWGLEDLSRPAPVVHYALLKWAFAALACVLTCYAAAS